MDKADAEFANKAIATVVINAIRFAGYDAVLLFCGEGDAAQSFDLVEFAHWLSDACAAVDAHIGLVEVDL